MSEQPKVQFFLTPEASAQGCQFTEPRPGDAGFDLCAAETINLEPGQQKLVASGLYLAIPLGWVGILKERSSVAYKRQLAVHAGVIDASYRGEVKILLSNRGSENQLIQDGEKIAQLVVVQHAVSCEAVSNLENLGQTGRGAAGFGSTGK